MKNTLMESRVRSLEEMMADLIATVEQTSLEVRASTEKMEEDTAKFKEKTDVTLERMERSTDRLKEEIRQDRRDLNKELGAIANKQGRMTEDLVAPSICRILLYVLGRPQSHECGQAERVRRFHPTIKGLRREFDVIAECDDYVLVNETKSSLQPSDIPKLKETISELREYFPEYKDRKIIGSLATLYVDDSLIKYASREGVIILAVGDELMDIKNESGFKPSEF
jgi:hypothetical protein